MVRTETDARDFYRIVCVLLFFSMGLPGMQAFLVFSPFLVL